MTSAGSIRAAKAHVEFGTENSPLRTGIRAAQRMVRGFFASVSTFGSQIMSSGGLAGALGGALGGAITTAPIVAAIADVVNAGGELADVSARIGASATAMQELAYAAQLSGAGMDVVETGLKKMQVNLASALSGEKSAIAMFEELGLKLEDLKKLKPEEQLAAIGDKISRIPDPAQRTATALALFGKTGNQLLPMLAGGAAGLNAMRQRARELGIVMSEQDVAAADELGDTLGDLRMSIQGIVRQLAAAGLPTLQEFANKAVKVAAGISFFVRNNRDAIASVVKWAAIGMAVFGVISLIGAELAVLSVGFGGIATGIGLVMSIMGTILSPIGLVIATVAGLAAWFVTSTNAGQSMFASLTAGWHAFAGEASGAWGAIVAAVSAGNIQAAIDVIAAYGGLQWERLVQGMTTRWSGFIGWVSTSWSMFSAASSSALSDTWSMFGVWFAQIDAGASRLSASIGDTLRKGMVYVGDGFYEVFAHFFEYLILGFATIEVAILSGMQTLLKQIGVDISKMTGEAFENARSLDRKIQDRANQRRGKRQEQFDKITAETQFEIDRANEREFKAHLGSGFNKPAALEPPAIIPAKPGPSARELEAEARLKSAEAALAKAVAAASKKSSVVQTPAGGGTNPGEAIELETVSREIRQVLSAPDIRTKEGLSALMPAFRGGEGTAQERTANGIRDLNTRTGEAVAKLDDIYFEIGRLYRDNTAPKPMALSGAATA